MAKIPGLFQRGKTWYLRLRIPKDLVESYGKKEITKSLETRDYSVACKRVNIERVDIEAEFQKKRQEIKAAAANTDMLSGYGDHELRALAMKWQHNLKKKEEARRIADTSTWTEEQRREHYIELRQEEQAARDEKLGKSYEEKHDGLTTASRFLKSEGNPCIRR